MSRRRVALALLLASAVLAACSSGPTRPAPLFRDFVGAARERARQRGRVAETATR